MKVFLTIAAAFLAKEASAEAHYGLPHLVPTYGYGYYGYGSVRPQVYGGIFGRRSHPVPFHPLGKREAEPETDSAFTYTVMAHHPKDQEMANNRYTLLNRMDSHRRMQQQQLMDESNMQQMGRQMQYRIMDQDQMMQQQQQRMGLNQQQIVNNMLDNQRDDLQQRRMLQYSMDSNQMMMHRDNVHDMSDMRLRDMQQQQHGMQSNLNRLDMNNQRMRMNNRQQMQQYRLDNDINQMQRMGMRLENNMRMRIKREAEGESDGDAGYGYQTYTETPFHKSFARAYYTNDIRVVPALHPVSAVPAVFNRGYSMYSAPLATGGVFVGHPHPAMGHPIVPFY